MDTQQRFSLLSPVLALLAATSLMACASGAGPSLPPGTSSPVEPGSETAPTPMFQVVPAAADDPTATTPTQTQTSPTPVTPPGTDPDPGDATPDAPPPPPPATSTALQASCPAGTTVDRFQATSLSGGVSAGTPSRFTWEVITRPAGSAAQPQPADAAFTQFTPDEDGDYVLRMTAFDSQGQAAGCDVPVTARFQGIRALVEWGAGAFTVELHMIDPLATRWFDGRDCNPGGCNADWGTAGDSLDDPSILVDLSGADPFDFIEVPRVNARAGDTYSLGFFVRPILDNVVNAATGTLAVQCGSDEPVAANFESAAEGQFVKGFNLVMRADGGCDVSVIGTVVTEDQARAVR